MQNVELRKAVAADLAAVTALCTAHAAYERASFDPTGHGERLARFIKGPHPRLTILLAIKPEEGAIGYAAVSREFSTWLAAEFLHMDCLFVQEAYRGQRVGRQLFAAALNEAGRQGVDHVEWQTPSWNDQGIRFYRSMLASESSKVRFRISPRPALMR